MIRFYIATERFGPGADSWMKKADYGWARYFEWAKIPQLVEVVSLDGVLCPPLIREFNDEDWNHTVQVGERIEFGELNYLLKRVQGRHPRNVLTAIRNPNGTQRLDEEIAWSFIGFDLIEDLTGISALAGFLSHLKMRS
jgi:hypothetical protein